MRSWGAVAILALMLLCTPADAQPPGWDLVWNDEFSGNSLDTSKWMAETTTSPANNEQQAYLPAQVTVSNGNMVITSVNQPFGGKPYRSGRVHSNFVKQYGRWEVRADLPTSRGMWPAIWLLPNTSQYNWPSQGEIDIMENRGHQPNLTSAAFHYGTNPPFNHQFRWSEQTTARFGQPVNYHNSFHVYAVEWDDTKLRFFIDDVHWYTIYNEDVGGFLGQQSAPMWTMLNTAVGGDFLGDQQPDGTTVWPQQFFVDYVRIYDRNDSPLSFQNGSFEGNSGSLAGWSVFGNRTNTNNVSAHNEAVSDGGTSLKLFGQFNGSENFSGVTQGISVAAGDEVRADANVFVRSQDSISGTANSLIMKIEFYDEFGAKFGTSSMLGVVETTVANNATVNNVWHPRELSAVAPASAAEARLAFVFRQPGFQGGAVHVDGVSFAVVPEVLSGDYNRNGIVDAGDYVVWRKSLGDEGLNLPADGDGNQVVNDDDFAYWKARFGNTSETGAGAFSAPEPSGFCLVIAAILSIAGARCKAPAFLPQSSSYQSD